MSSEESRNLGIDFTSGCHTGRASNYDYQIEDLVEKGVIDPVHVVKNSLMYGASIASILLTADCAILHKPEDGKRIVEHEELHI